MQPALYRIGFCASAVSVVLALTAGGAAAKCCPLKYVTVSDFHGEDLRIDSSVLEDRLEDWEMQLLSWPVSNGTGKGKESPPGRLGPGYLVTYVHETWDSEGEAGVRERIYPFAEPAPVAFTLKGQTQDWIEADNRVYPVAWGWRPVQQGIVSALFDHEDVDRAGVQGDASDGGAAGYLPLSAIALVAAALVLVWRRRRDGQQVSTAPVRIDP